MKNLKFLGISTGIVAILLVPSSGSADSTAAKNAAKNANDKNCPNCTVPPADNSSVAKLGKVINGLKNSTSCNGVLTNETEIGIAQGAASIAQQYLSGKITDAQRIAQTKALVRKSAGGDTDKQVAAAGLADSVTGALAHNYALSIGLGKAFDKPPYHYSDEQKQMLTKFGLSPKDFDSFVDSQTKPYMPYITKLAAIGASHTAEKGWDFSNVQFNVNDLKTDKRLLDAFKWAAGNQANDSDIIKSLSDPGRKQAFQLGSLMVLPPQPQKDKSGTVSPGEMRVMSVDDYNKEVSSTLDTWKSSVTEFLSASKASSGFWNLLKQGWNSKGFGGWQNWMAWNKLTKTGDYQAGSTAESREMNQAGNALSASQLKLINQLGVSKDLAAQVLNVNKQAFTTSSDEFDDASKTIDKTISGLHWAPLVAAAVVIDPQALQFALMPFEFGAAKAAVNAGIDVWRFGGGVGGIACHFATDMSSQLGDDLLASRWAFAGGLGKVVGLASPLVGAAVQTGTSGYFMYGMGKGAIQEGMQAWDAHKLYVQYKAQGNDAMANVAVANGFKAAAGAGIDGAMVVTGTVATVEEAGAMAKESTPGKALTNYLATGARLKEGQYRAGDVFTDPNGKTYKVLDKQYVKQDADTAAIKEKTGKTVRQGEAVYLVRRTDANAGDAAEKTFPVFQSDLEIPTRGKDGKTVMKANSKAAKIRVAPDAFEPVTDVANANAATPQQLSFISTDMAHTGDVEATQHAIAAYLAHASDIPDNDGAYQKYLTVKRSKTPAPELSANNINFFRQGDDTFFRRKDSTDVFKITNPDLKADIDQTIVASKAPEVREGLKLNQTLDNTLASSKSEPVTRIPDAAKTVVARPDWLLQKDDAGNFYQRRYGDVGGTKIAAADAGSVVKVAGQIDTARKYGNYADDAPTERKPVETKVAEQKPAVAPGNADGVRDDVSQKLFKNGKLKTGWFSPLVEASQADAISLKQNVRDADFTMNGVDFFRAKAADDATPGAKENIYARDSEGKLYRIKDGDVAAKLGKMIDAGPGENPADTQKELASVSQENDKTPSKKKLAGRLWDSFVKWKQKTDKSFSDKIDGVGKSIKESTAGKKASEAGKRLAEKTGYDKVQAAAKDHLIIEQAVRELDPVEASKIADQLEKDPKAQEKVEKIAEECGMGGGAGAAVARNDDDFLDSLGVLYTDNDVEENSCTL